MDAVRHRQLRAAAALPFLREWRSVFRCAVACQYKKEEKENEVFH